MNDRQKKAMGCCRVIAAIERRRDPEGRLLPRDKILLRERMDMARTLREEAEKEGDHVTLNILDAIATNGEDGHST